MIQEIIGNVLIFISVLVVFIGILGVYRFNNFYAKLLASSKVDTVAMITLIIGIMVRSGLNWFTLKVLLLLLLVIFINPIITSRIVLSVRKEELCVEEGLCEVELTKRV